VIPLTKQQLKQLIREEVDAAAAEKVQQRGGKWFFNDAAMMVNIAKHIRHTAKSKGTTLTSGQLKQLVRIYMSSGLSIEEFINMYAESGLNIDQLIVLIKQLPSQ